MNDDQSFFRRLAWKQAFVTVFAVGLFLGIAVLAAMFLPGGHQTASSVLNIIQVLGGFAFTIALAAIFLVEAWLGGWLFRRRAIDNLDEFVEPNKPFSVIEHILLGLAAGLANGVLVLVMYFVFWGVPGFSGLFVSLGATQYPQEVIPVGWLFYGWVVFTLLYWAAGSHDWEF